jgi:tetratricopeptide (TPR) repeat protein
MTLFLIIGVIVAIGGLLTTLFLVKIRRKRRVRVVQWEKKEDITEHRLRIWTYIFGIVTILGVAIAILAWIFPAPPKLPKETEQRIQSIEKEAKEANENIKRIEEHFGIKPYVDGLTSSPPAVFDPFAKGLKLMTEYKWNQAITEFKQSMKEAKASQLVALYNLIGICYYTPGKFDLTLENWNKSLSLAREFNDKEGEAKALGNLGIVYGIRGDLDKAIKYFEDALKIDIEIRNKEGEAADLGNLGNVYYTRGELDKAIKYHEDALKLAREIGNKEGEASDLGNLGNVYYTRGELDKAIKYHEDALKIDREIGNKKGEAEDLKNLGLVFGVKGEKEKALKYLEDALKLFTQIGAKREIEKVKENIKRLKGE